MNDPEKTFFRLYRTTHLQKGTAEGTVQLCDGASYGRAECVQRLVTDVKKHVFGGSDVSEKGASRGEISCCGEAGEHLPLGVTVLQGRSVQRVLDAFMGSEGNLVEVLYD